MGFGTCSLKGYKEAMEIFDPARIKKVVERSLYRTGKQVRTRASSAIRSGYNIKKENLDKNIIVERATMEVKLRCSGKNLNAREYGPVTQSRVLGAIINIRRDRPNKVISHSFIINKFGGKVFLRKGKSRFPIVPVTGPSVKQLMGSKYIGKVIQKTLNEVAQKNFDAQLKAVTGATVDLPE